MEILIILYLGEGKTVTEQELRALAMDIDKSFRNEEMSDDEIISRIKDTPELINVTLLSGANLFLSSVRWNRPQITKVLAEMGSDIHWKIDASAVSGNALNVARTPETAEYLLSIGLEIERNCSIRESYWNPAIKAVHLNNCEMVLYWLKKEKELFKDDKVYIDELVKTAVENAVCYLNQSNMLSCMMANDELYSVMKAVYMQVDNVDSIKLYLGSLRQISDKTLESRKKELRNVLNVRKRELSK